MPHAILSSTVVANSIGLFSFLNGAVFPELNSKVIVPHVPANAPPLAEMLPASGFVLTKSEPL